MGQLIFVELTDMEVVQYESNRMPHEFPLF